MRAESAGLPFRMRPDLQVSPVEWGGELLFVVKDPVALRYFHLPSAQFQALSKLQGCADLGDWANRLDEAAEIPSLVQLRSWLREFVQWGLVTRERWTSESTERTAQRTWPARLWTTLRNPLYIQFPGFDPSRPLNWLQAGCGWLCTPWGVLLTLSLAAAIWLQTLTVFDEFLQRLPTWEAFRHPWTWVSIWLALGATKIIHELAHGLVARRLGAECHAIGMALVLFSPCLYCDVSDCWKLPSRRSRIAIALAGIWAETVLGALALAAWWLTRPGWWHDWCWHVAAVSSLSTLLVNLNPLARYDGYFVLCDLWGIPNLRQQADASLNQSLRRMVHGENPEAVASDRGSSRSPLLAVYALAAGAYRLSIVISMAWVLQAMLAPYGLETLVGVYVALAVGTLITGMAIRWRRVVGGGQGLRPWLVTGALLASVLAAGWGVLRYPIGWPESAPFVVDARSSETVFVTTPGTLVAVQAQPGDVVIPGQVIAVLGNPELERQRLQLLVRCAEQEQEIELARVQDLPGVRQEAEAVLQTLAAQLMELERRRERLVVRAGAAGTLQAPNWKEPPAETLEAERLPTWSGHPLSAHNLGAWFDAGTAVMCILPSQERRALVQLEQRQRPQLEVGSHVELQPEGQPRVRLRGVVSEIAARTTDDIPTELTHGPRAAENHTATGVATGPAAVFPVIVLFQDDTAALPLGSTGLARMISPPRTLWQRGIDRLRQSVPQWW